MNILEQTLNLCKLHNIKPQRSKGQNFLIEEGYYDQIIAAAELTKQDLVLEVGPGLGFLTAKLAKAARQVVTVELDDKLAVLLKTTLAEQAITNVNLINGNVLDIAVGEGNDKYKIVANLPYNITSVFLRKFLEQVKNKPETLVLMLQKEVAERICAKPGEMSVLAISVQYYAEAEIIGYVPAKAFYPAPEVQSAVIKIKVRKDKNARDADTKDFFRLVKFGFSARRKMLKNTLAGSYHITQTEAAAWLLRAGFKETARPQELSIEDWQKLLKSKE